MNMKSLPLEQYVELFKPEKLDNIKSYIYPPENWPTDCEVVAMDMGGTNFRIGRVKFDRSGNAEIYDFKKFKMPGVVEKITSDEFFDFFNQMKEEYHAKKIGLCFSYPAEILQDGRAKIITFSKEIKIEGAEDKVIDAKVVNDTTAAQLGTKGANMGLILGTGFNICYNYNGVIINSEAGRCTDFPTEDFDFGPLSEMQVSGKYLKPLIAKGVATAEEIYERGAKIVAAEIYGIAKYAGLEEVRIAAEGAVFYNVPEIQDLIRANLDTLGLKYSFLDGRDKTLIGAALAALI